MRDNLAGTWKGTWHSTLAHVHLFRNRLLRPFPVLRVAPQTSLHLPSSAFIFVPGDIYAQRLQPTVHLSCDHLCGVVGEPLISFSVLVLSFELASRIQNSLSPSLSSLVRHPSFFLLLGLRQAPSQRTARPISLLFDSTTFYEPHAPICRPVDRR